MKKRTLVIVSILLLVCLTLTLIACDNAITPNTGDDTPTLEQMLSESLKSYLTSDSYASASSAKTTQDRLPLAYLRYVDMSQYDLIEDGGVVIHSLGLITSVIDSNGELSDELYSAADCPLYEIIESEWGSYTSGWSSITDYLFSWSIMYNQYKQFCIESSSNAYVNLYGKYLDTIKTYLSAKDSEAYIPVAWGFDKNSVLTLTCHNLGFDAKTVVPTSYNALLAYYQKDSYGSFVTASGYSNWVGFTGRPLAGGTLLKEESAYDVAYEKTMQGLFPYKDNYDTDIAIDETVNLDRLCSYYGYEIESDYGSTEDSRYGILYGYLNGIDMTSYKKEVYDADEQEGKAYDVLAMWLATLNKDGNGNYVLADQTDMAVAIAYLAYQKGVSATPCGAYSSELSIIKLA